MHYMFEQSKLWDGSEHEVDPHGRWLRVKAKNEIRARRNLPNELGRTWLLIKASSTPIPNPGRFLVTDGMGMRLEFDFLEDALKAWTSPFWHVYEWKTFEWVQIR